jgi:hypothetical protein
MLGSFVRIAAGVVSLLFCHETVSPLSGQTPAPVVRGSVATPTGHPVQGAEIMVLGDSAAAFTDSSGRFVLRGIPLGEHVIRVRRIGFRAQALAINLRAGEEKEVTIALTLGVYELPELAVTARLAKPIEYAWTTKYDEFFRRKLVGLGRYVSRQDIDKKAASHTSEILAGVPGVRVLFGAPGISPDMVKFIGCNQISVWVDGAELHPLAGVAPAPRSMGGASTVDALGGRPQGQRDPAAVGEMLDRIHPLQIEMIEVYTGPGRMQAEFLGNSCGAIAIWTR